MGKLMEAKYIQAIKAGIIGGVILAVCMLATLFIDIINSNAYVYSGLTGLGLLSCCIFIVEIIVLVGTGALAVQMAKSLVVKLDEAAVVGAAAGAVAGLIGTVIQVISAVVRPWLSNVSSYANYYNYYPYNTYGIGSSTLSMFGGLVGAVCCCGPMLIIVGAILAAIGGAIYAVAVLKVK